jgi:hypothetical protein
MHLAGYNTVHNPDDRSVSLPKTSLFSEITTVRYPTYMSNPRLPLLPRTVRFLGTWLHLILTVSLPGTWLHLVLTVSFLGTWLHLLLTVSFLGTWLHLVLTVSFLGTWLHLVLTVSFLGTWLHLVLDCELPRYLATSCTHCLQTPYSRHLLFCGTDKCCRSLPGFRVCLPSVSGHYIPLHYQGTQNKSHMNASCTDYLWLLVISFR